MKKLGLILVAGVLFSACNSQSEQHQQSMRELVRAINDGFQRVAELSCSDPVPWTAEVGGLMTAKNVDENFRVIIDALEKKKCTKQRK